MVLQATDQFTIFPRHTASSMVHMQAMVQLLQDGPCKMSRSPSTVSRDVGDTSRQASTHKTSSKHDGDTIIMRK